MEEYLSIYNSTSQHTYWSYTFILSPSVLGTLFIDFFMFEKIFNYNGFKLSQSKTFILKYLLKCVSLIYNLMEVSTTFMTNKFRCKLNLKLCIE
jgi:hypothetical protein